MRLEHRAPELNRHQGRTFRHDPWQDLLGALGTAAIVGGAGFAGWKLWQASIGLLWLVVGPMLALTGGLFLLISAALFSAFLASLRSTNWLAALEQSRLHLNLRSYRNGHFGRELPTVLVLEASEIESVARHTELRTRAGSDGPERTRKRWIELRLANVDTDAIAAACRAERCAPAPTRRFAGVESSTKHHHVTVCVPGAGRVWVEDLRGLHAGLLERFSAGEDGRTDLDETLADASLEERALTFLARGERLDAFRLVREELELSEREAKDWVLDLESRAA
ncbi:MAG: hypothetical protein ACYS26_03580 [Planctomycetota bacterium]|jgi:hypothetical protein